MPKPRIQTPEMLAQIRAEILEECRAKEAKGIEIQGCDFTLPEDTMTKAEATKLIVVWTAEQRRKYPGNWVGDKLGKARELAYEHAIVRDHIKELRQKRAQ